MPVGAAHTRGRHRDHHPVGGARRLGHVGDGGQLTQGAVDDGLHGERLPGRVVDPATATVATVTRLLHLNGPPGIGKSTLARRYATDHPGVLVCDIDLLRTLVGGWESRFGETGALIRPAALAMITAYLSGGHDVVLPQMLVRPEELARFEAAARTAGARLRRALRDGHARTPRSRGSTAGAARSHRCGARPWHDQVRAIVAADGGDESLRAYHAGLVRFIASDRARSSSTSVEGRLDATYAALLASLGDS